MQNKKIKGSLSGIVDKMNQVYDGLMGKGFSPQLEGVLAMGQSRLICPNKIMVN